MGIHTPKKLGIIRGCEFQFLKEDDSYKGRKTITSEKDNYYQGSISDGTRGDLVGAKIIGARWNLSGEFIQETSNIGNDDWKDHKDERYDLTESELKRIQGAVY